MGCTILVVDDSATMRAIIKTYVAKLTCTVLEAASVDEALSLAAAQPIDVLVSDIWLGGRSGLELVEALSRPPLRRPRGVVLISSDDSEGLQAKVRVLGADAFVKKPFAPGRLVRELDRLLPGAAASR